MLTVNDPSDMQKIFEACVVENSGSFMLGLNSHTPHQRGLWDRISVLLAGWKQQSDSWVEVYWFAHKSLPCSRILGDRGSHVHKDLGHISTPARTVPDPSKLITHDCISVKPLQTRSRWIYPSVNVISRKINVDGVSSFKCLGYIRAYAVVCGTLGSADVYVSRSERMWLTCGWTRSRVFVKSASGLIEFRRSVITINNQHVFPAFSRFHSAKKTVPLASFFSSLRPPQVFPHIVLFGSEARGVSSTVRTDSCCSPQTREEQRTATDCSSTAATIRNY